MKQCDVQLEPWTDALWSELQALAQAHAREVDEGVEPRRPFELDLDIVRHAAELGIFKIFVGRGPDRAAVGYFTWNVLPDVESRGLLIGLQGAWYVAPGHFRLAHRMFDLSLHGLKALGVKMVFPHHRTQGRGQGIGRHFRRRGAKLIQHTYSLWIGD